MDTLQQCEMQVKWTTTNQTKDKSSSKEADAMYIVGLEGVLY